jgi:F-type H+-transporting ATPase subunit alpha
MNKEAILSQLKEEILKVSGKAEKSEVGEVIRSGDGVAEIKGLSNVMYSELLEFEGVEGVSAMALNLEEQSVKAIILGDSKKVKEGQTVKSTGNVLSIPVSDKLVGRVIDPLGNPKDGGPSIPKESSKRYPLEKIAPGVITRESVKTPLHTGWKAIDAVIPIGRGQRELIIGDRQTGKTALAIDAIINQGKEKKFSTPICIYVAVGQKESKVAQIVEKLRKTGAMNYTIVVTAAASEAAALQFLAPYAGCAIGEYFMDQGKDAFVVYDDLSKQAVVYREVSLLLRRPPR